jgi:hypothetical protein
LREKKNIASGLTPVNYTLPLDEWCRYLVTTTYLPINWWVGLGRAACRHQAHQFLWQNTLHKIDHSTRHLFIEQMALIYWTWTSSCTGCALYGRFWVLGLAPLLSRKRTEEETQRRRERWKRLGVSITLKSFIVKFLASTWSQLCGDSLRVET